MAPVLVDSNVWIDLINADEPWSDWSAEVINRYGQTHALTINPIIYGEVSIRYERLEEVDAFLPEASIHRQPLPWEAAFLAGKCHLRYRQRGGTRQSILPDFFIGAHAAVVGMPLITRDAARYRTYFPKLKIIAPE